MATLQDIADATGLTAMTVSRILNGRNKENRPTMVARAAEVRRIAEQLGYRPFIPARNMRQGRTGLVALVRNPHAGGSQIMGFLLHQLASRLALINRDLLLADITAGGDRPSLIHERRVDGLLVDDISPIPSAMRAAIAHWRTPSVWLNVRLDHAAVHPDDTGGGRLAATFLASRGCRRIAFLSLSGDSHYSVADRAAGLREVLGKHLTTDIRCNPASGLASTAVARELLAGPDRPDAVVAYGEREAAAVLAAAADLGIRLPQQLQLMAFAPVLIDHLGQLVTTVRIPLGRLAVQAVEALEQAMQDPRVRPRTRAVPFLDIDVGETTA